MTSMNSEQRDKFMLFANTFISYPRAKAVFEKFDELRETSRDYRTRPSETKFAYKSLSWMSMFAPTGSGKTGIINAYMKRVESEAMPKGSRPVVFVNLPANSTAKDFYIKVLEAFGDPNARLGTKSQLEQRVYAFMHACAVEMLIVDEVQHLLNPDTSRLNQDVAAIFKNMLNAQECSLILSGTEDISILDSDKGQLARRAIPSVDLMPLNSNIEEERIIFWGFLLKLDRKMEQLGITDGPNGFSEKKVQAAMYQVSGGRIGIAWHVIEHALVYCFKHGGRHIEIPDLVWATDEWAIKRKFTTKNPFRALLTL